MASTARSTWKRAEAGVAALFGARRRVLSGSSNRPDIDGDDTTHPRLFIEVKLRATHTVWGLFRSVKAKAAKCRRDFQGAHKVPVLGLREKGRHGALLVVHEDDFREVVVEWLSAQSDDTVNGVEAAVRVRRLGIETQED